MTITRKVAAALGAIILVGGAAGTAQAGIQGLLSVYNQSADPYHIFVEGRRAGTVHQGQTLRLPVNDWRGPTQLVAIKAGSQGQFRFVKHVRTCQVARWELHTRWERLRTFGGPQHVRPPHGGWHHGRPPHGGWHHSRPPYGGAGFHVTLRSFDDLFGGRQHRDDDDDRRFARRRRHDDD